MVKTRQNSHHHHSCNDHQFDKQDTSINGNGYHYYSSDSSTSRSRPSSRMSEENGGKLSLTRSFSRSCSVSSENPELSICSLSYNSGDSSISHSRPSSGTPEDTLSLTRSISRSCSVSSEKPALSIWTLSKTQKALLVTTNLADLLAYLSISIMAPFFPEEALAKGVSDTLSGWIFGTSPFTQFILSPVLGKLIPIIGLKFMFISSMFLFSACTILFGLLTYVPVGNGNGVFIALSFILQVLRSVGVAAMNNASFVMSVQAFPDHIATVFGISEIFVGMGLVAGPAIGGLLYGLDGFYLPFVTIGGLAMLSVPMMWWVVPEQKAFVETGKKRMSIRKVFLSFRGILTTVSIVLGAYMWSILDPTLEPYLRKFNLSPEIVGVLFLVMALVYSLSAPLWGWVSDKLNDQRLLIAVGFLFASLGSLLIGPSPLIGFDENFSELWLVVLALGILGGAASMSIIPTLDMYFTFAEEAGCEDDIKTYGFVAGVWMSMYSLGDFLGLSIGGILLDNVGFRDSCTYTAGICLLMFFIIMLSWMCNLKCCRCSKMNDSYEQLSDDYIPLSSDCNRTGNNDECFAAINTHDSHLDSVV